jgi:hypothetical protein
MPGPFLVPAVAGFKEELSESRREKFSKQSFASSAFWGRDGHGTLSGRHKINQRAVTLHRGG